MLASIRDASRGGVATMGRLAAPMTDDKPDKDDGAGYVTIYATFPGVETAAGVAEALVRSGLVACANIIPGITSIYIWESRLEREQEVAMLMKTSRALVGEVTAEVRRLHPYENPAIVALPIVGGSADYLAWIGQSTANLRARLP
jgi:periplasmic divalent cation tolerance protein